jgi:hypothetical protein
LTYQPLTQVLLSIEKPLQDSITTDSGIKFYLNPDYNREWNVAVVATIVSLPSNPNPKDKKILEKVKIGDKVCVSYQIVSEVTFGSDGDSFMLATEDNPYVREFYNGKGQTVRVYALPKRAGIAGAIWCAVLMDNRRQLIDGIQGTESEVEKWLSQFPFGKTNIYTFNNFFEYDGKDYWVCNLTDIFAVKRKGHLVAVGDRIITKPVDEEVPDQFLINDNGLAEKIMVRHKDRGRVISGGKEKGIKKEDIVSFEPQFCEKYDFFGHQYFLIKENFVLGKWN